MKFFYWCDHENPRLSPIIKSAENNQIEVQQIGAGPIEGEWSTSLFKQRALFEAVKNLPDDEIVCATDAFDVFYQQDSEYLRKQFLSFNQEIVFSAERGFSHQYLKYKPYYDKRRQASPYKYLNAGNVIGYAGAIRKLYKPGRLFSIKVALTRQHHIRRVLHLCSYIYARIRSKITGQKVSNFFFPWYYYSDQAIMAKRVARNFRQLSIDLDRSSKLFWCTAFEWKDIEHHYRLVDGKLQNLHTGHIPACIHVPDSANYEYVFLRLFELVHRS